MKSSSSSILEKIKKAHFVGIGGIGMSAIAQILLKRGITISGSDVSDTPLIRKLRRMGASVSIGHARKNVPDNVNMVVYSSCIPLGNPELEAARVLKAPIVPRGQVLAELINSKKSIAVAGSHGKTTTTSMISVIMKKAGLNPTALIGGEVDSLGGNAYMGDSQYMVCETDESDGSFLALKPTYSVITNIDADHLDYHKSKAGLVEAFCEYVSRTKPEGYLIYWHDEPAKASLLKSFQGKGSVSFGLGKNARIRAQEIKLGKQGCSFACFDQDVELGDIELSVTGTHNVIDALATIAAARCVGLDFDVIKKALKDFSGVKRRFQIRGQRRGVMFVEDYAHHPTEIKAAIAQAKLWQKKRVVAVFQPHRYSRTLHLKDEFGSCFNLSDYLILTDIYPAGEHPIEGIDGRSIYNSVKQNGFRGPCNYLKTDEIAAHLKKIAKKDDLVLVLGAGNINKVLDEVC